MTTKKHCIGIDLGTTNSVLAYFNEETESVEIISNLAGERLTPSIVRFMGTEIMVGQNAIESTSNSTEEELDLYPTISHVKRMIGRKYTPTLDIIETLDYQVESDSSDFPMIPVDKSKNPNKLLKPEEISAEVLRYLKESAETHLGIDITQAVITVPAYFNEAQRRATRDACTLAGLECLRLVPEPTAACLCYGLHKSQEETVLVYDLGGGTLDTSILQLHGGVFEVVATSGNTQLGGADVDNLIINFLQKKLLDQENKENKEKENKEKENKENNEIENKEGRITQQMAENIKKNLSSRSQYTFRLGTFKYTITRTEFEELIADFVDACMEPVDQVLKDANMSPSDISQVVLVGGSTRIPIIQSTLSQWFNGKTLNKSINPDEAVAYGAAVQATIIQKVGSKARDLLLLDVNPLSLGIETSGGIMNPIIKRNSTLPCEASKVFSTVDDNQESVDIQVFQGERQFTADNIKLGVFTLEGLPKGARGVPKILVKFTLDCDGLLHVSAVDKNTGLASSISLNSESNLSGEQIDRMLKVAESNRVRDYNRKCAIEQLSKFEKYVVEMQRQFNLPENRNTIGEEEISPLNQYLMNIMEWIVARRHRTSSDQDQLSTTQPEEEIIKSDTESIQACRDEVEYRLKPYIDRIYSHQQQLQDSGINTKGPISNQTKGLEELMGDICK
jgi:molecular chaperone DnaK (HSP70)